MEEIKNKILEEYKKGNIVVAGIEGLQGMPISEFIKQPVEGMLYDLNRNEAIVLTFLPDPKWINDYAVAQVIRALKNRIDELEGVSKIDFLDTKIDDCDLSIRTKNVCRMNDFKVIRDLIACSTKDLMTLRFGKRTIKEIQELLSSKGYSFGS